MGWSTRELAELAGATVKAVRYYHDIGVLEQPVRASNGYKQYGIAHLLRVLQIKRLTALGFSLAQVAAMGDEIDHPEHSLRALDAELAATIERLQRARIELGSILRHSARPDLPHDIALASRDGKLTDADRSFATYLSGVLDPPALAAYSEILRTPATPAGTDFDELPADADESTRADIARRMIPEVAALTEKHPGVSAALTARGPRTVRDVREVMFELYNPAQLDVLRRVGLGLRD
ncbi:MerR family transcriptional regulator [Nocardia ninae]|uniref:Transcriptional regulator, MerR family protein n=1 Tax=Nocardia ninae NBRC 108245 TaxID=1210091 RepID=A0A511ME21_9NOCA|nr:MerR family transcriptional regulator [Nocardia ninae]GEM38731.1 transcriptional regulator, MerR family protein [Nocardia ninae NBRC 108245]